MTSYRKEHQNKWRDRMTDCTCVINGHCMCYQMGVGERCECEFECDCYECDDMQSYLIIKNAEMAEAMGCPCGGNCQCGGTE